MQARTVKALGDAHLLRTTLLQQYRARVVSELPPRTPASPEVLARDARVAAKRGEEVEVAGRVRAQEEVVRRVSAEVQRRERELQVGWNTRP